MTRLPASSRTLTRRTSVALHLPLLALVGLLASPALSASPLTGTVTNKTNNRPAAGDTVVMLNLSQGMQEGGRTKTDAGGHFTLDAGEGPHLIRVDHQKASYFREAPPGTASVTIDVYDVLAKVPQVSTEADVMRVEADQQGLHVVESYFVKNESSPPKTQLSDHSFEISLPVDAQIEGSAALAPGGMPVSSSPTPLGEKGHYAFIFPLRPGETRFQLSYRIPYSGSYKFSPHLYMATETIAVMLPKAMKFQSGPSSQYQAINEDVNAQTFVAKNVSPSQPLEFTVSGLGSMPRETQSQGGQAAQQAAANGPGAPSGAGDRTGQGSPTASPSDDTRPGGGLGTPIDTPDPLTKYRWWILFGLSIALAVAAALLLRRKSVGAGAESFAPVGVAAQTFAAVAAPPGAGGAIVANHHAPQSTILAALKDELFTLETERLEGKITEPEYAQAKAALEIVLRRALTRRAS